MLNLSTVVAQAGFEIQLFRREFSVENLAPCPRLFARSAQLSEYSANPGFPATF